MSRRAEMREEKGEMKGRGWRRKVWEEPAVPMKKSFPRLWLAETETDIV